MLDEAQRNFGHSKSDIQPVDDPFPLPVDGLYFARNRIESVE
jgi:hypothetical protein